MSRPSNNEFRIVGALGLTQNPTETNAQHVLQQGIGFPPRPISGVLPLDAPEIDEDVIAKGLPQQWMGNWQEGKYYPPGAFVRDGQFTATAIRLTLEKPAPVPDPANPASTGLPDPWVGVTTASNISEVVSGQKYVFSESGWIKELKVFAPAITPDIDYRVIMIDDTDPANPITSTIEGMTLVEDEWAIVALLDVIVTIGTSLSFSLEALHSNASTNISGGWAYSGPTQPPTAPLLSGWTQDNQRSNFRIDKTDLDSTDRGSELEGVTVDSVISVVETASVGNSVGYRVTSVTDSGSYMTYGVVLQSETGAIGAGATCTLDIDIPIPLATEYAEEALVWATPPSWASSAESFLFFDGVKQPAADTTAYGLDILFSPASVSEDWHLVSTPV